jgi:hypothetical protein
MNNLSRVVSPRTGEHGHLPPGLFDANLDDAASLLFRERRAFAGRTARDEKVNAFIDLTPRQPADATFVQCEGLRERGYDRGTNAGKCLSHADLFSS